MLGFALDLLVSSSILSNVWIIGRAGASPPSLTAWACCLYIILYIYGTATDRIPKCFYVNFLKSHHGSPYIMCLRMYVHHQHFILTGPGHNTNVVCKKRTVEGASRH